MAKVVALVALAMALVGCAQVEPTMHEVASDTTGELVYLKTLDGQLGYHFWICHRKGQRGMACERLCDHDRFDDRLCSPEYHHEFGEISGPDSTRLVERERRRAQEEMQEAIDEAAEDARQREQEERRRRAPPSSEQEDGEDEDEQDAEQEDQPSNGALP